MSVFHKHVLCVFKKISFNSFGIMWRVSYTCCETHKGPFTLAIFVAIPNRACKLAAISWRFRGDLSPLFRACSNLDAINWLLINTLRNNGVKVGYKPLNVMRTCFPRPKDKHSTLRSRGVATSCIMDRRTEPWKQG